MPASHEKCSSKSIADLWFVQTVIEKEVLSAELSQALQIYTLKWMHNLVVVQQ